MSVGGFVLITACLVSMLATQIHCSCRCDCPSPVLYQTHKFYLKQPALIPRPHPNRIEGHAYQGGNLAYHAPQAPYHAQQAPYHAQQGPKHVQQVSFPALLIQSGLDTADHKVGQQQEEEKQQDSFFLAALAQAQEASKCSGGTGRGYCGDEGKEEQQLSSVQQIEKPQRESTIIKMPVGDYFEFGNGAQKGLLKESPIGEVKKENHNEEDEDHHHHQHHDHDKNAYYKFAYAVNDKKTHDVKYQKEERKGDVVTGEYSLLEDDGNVRTVKYVADWKNGFRAQVLNSKKQKSDYFGFAR